MISILIIHQENQEQQNDSSETAPVLLFHSSFTIFGNGSHHWQVSLSLTLICVNKIECRVSSEKTPIVGEIQKVQSLLAHRV
jgi:hypothetical protein